MKGERILSEYERWTQSQHSRDSRARFDLFAVSDQGDFRPRRALHLTYQNDSFLYDDGGVGQRLDEDGRVA